MEEIFQKIKIIPLKDTYIHEGTVEKWVVRLANFLEYDGLMKNPVIVSEKDGKYIVLDGMHRVGALNFLQCKDILAYVIDINREDVILSSWDGLILGFHNVIDLIYEVLKTKKEFEISEMPDMPVNEFQAKVKNREFLLGYISKINNRKIAITSKKNDLDTLIGLITSIENKIDSNNFQMLYAPDNKSYSDLMQTDSTGLLFRPLFTKEEIIKRTLEQKLFPRKSTRFLIPERPLRVDINFLLLKESLPLDIKNKFLQAHLKWCWSNNKVRYYPESVFVFND